MSAAAGKGAPEARHTMSRIERTVRLVLMAGITVSVALLVFGLVLVVARGGGIPHGTVPLGSMASGLRALQPAAYLSLGLIVLIGTPFVRVAGSLVAFAEEHDGRYVLITATVLLVMCLSVVLGKV